MKFRTLNIQLIAILLICSCTLTPATNPLSNDLGVNGDDDGTRSTSTIGNSLLGADEPVTFTNVSEQIGLSSLGVKINKIQWGDYDNDGDLDLLCNDKYLFRNNGVETGTWDFTNVTTESGITGGAGIWGDYDRDGFLDTFGKKLWHNNGDGTFTDVTSTAFPLGIPWSNYITCAGWGDYDKDGYLDLYIVRGEDWGNQMYYPDDLWHNNGDGTFTNVTEASGIGAVEGLVPSTPGKPPNYGRGVTWVDYNNDNWLDIYISNYRQAANYLFKNNGNGTFTNTAPDTGCLHDAPQDNTDWNNQDPYNRGGHTIGSVWGDFENDGDFDVWVNNFNHKNWRTSDDALLCRNNGPPDYTFTNFAGTAGIHRKPWNDTSAPQGDDLLSGNAFGDYDNDGDLDLWLTQVYGSTSYAYSYLYRHDGVASQTFTQVANDIYDDPMGVRIWDTYAGIFVDYDNDGDLDLTTAGKYPHTDGTYMVRVFQNSGNSNSWLNVKLVGYDCDKFGVGARIYVNQTSPPYLTLMDWIHTSQGAHNHANGLISHFGLGDYSGTVNITVLWPCGMKTTLNNEAVNQIRTVYEAGPEVILLAPNPMGTDIINSGITNINWVATDIEHDDSTLLIDIDYSDDGGDSWTNIATGFPNTPVYPWDTSTVADGTNYLIKVSATSSIGKTGFAQTMQPFSIDNSLDDVWHFQVQASGPRMDLDMKPVEIMPNIAQTQLLVGTGDFLVDRWETTQTFTGEVIDGDWTFDIYGYTTDPGLMVGNLYAKVFTSSNLGIPLDVTVLDNENVGNLESSHLFTWTDTLAGVIPDGDSLVFELWLNLGTGSGGPQTTTYDYTTGAGTTKFAYFGDLDAMPPDGGTVPDPFMNSKVECGDYSAIQSSNNVYWTSTNPGLADETFVWSDIQVTDNPSWVTQIDLTFEGMCNRAGNFQIWAFNQNTAVWEQIDTSEPYTASFEETVTRSIITNMADYFLNGTLTWGVYEDAQMGVIDVDYLEVLVHYTVPYPLYSMEFDFGLAKSKVVTPFGLPLISHDIPIADPGGPWPAWRFLSFPITAIGDVASVLDDALGDSGTTWDMAQWYDPTDSDDHWKSYNAYAPALSDIPSVNNRMGLWVHITANDGDGELTAGMGNYPGSTTIIQLSTGWNLVGYPSATPRTADTTLPIEVTSMAVYNSAQPYDLTDVSDLSSVLMQEDEAYWLHVTADCTWQVDP